MGLYTKVNGTTQEITQLSVNVDGVAKNVHTVYTQIDGVRTRLFPSTEVWTLVYEGTNPGSYTYNANWGSYQIVLSGGGGAGAAVARYNGGTIDFNYSGSAGEEKTVLVNVYENENKVFSGIIGNGGNSAYAIATSNNLNATAGTGGAGYQNGSVGGSYTHNTLAARFGMASGGGGGSSSIVVDSTLRDIAAGGNGGSCQVDPSHHEQTHIRYGGVGGNGGTGSGRGAAGGIAKSILNGAIYSGAGSNGYVRIYKSNILPEAGAPGE